MSKNYGLMNIGTFKEDLAKAGRIMADESLGLTGCEMSFNYSPAGSYTPFVHSHKLNEEVYVIISGNGQLMVDDEEFSIQEGSVIRVAPNGQRAIKADSDLTYLCIQVKENSLTQATMDDAIINEAKASWME